MAESSRREESKWPTGNRLFLLVLAFLIPIPFSPWWLGIICFSAFALLVWLAKNEV